MNDKVTKLNEILHSMDVPSSRKDASKAGNAIWLIRNLAIRNSADKNFNKAIGLLKEMVK
jgi:hypothetical protein